MTSNQTPIKLKKPDLSLLTGLQWENNDLNHIELSEYLIGKEFGKDGANMENGLISTGRNG